MASEQNHRVQPLTPEFAELLLTTPEHERSGRVFKLTALKCHGERLTVDRVTRIVSAIGRKAGRIVNQHRERFASAHDLRRSFGARWAAEVMPLTPMELMRHESIDTTLRYYVGRNAQRTTKVLRDDYEQRQLDNALANRRDTGGDTPPSEDTHGEK